MKDAALAQELRELATAVENLRMDPHIRTAPDTAALLARMVKLVEHLSVRIDHLEDQRPAK